MKKLAVIIVNWNGEKYVKECLDSFATQTFKDYVIYFVDNDSSDRSLAIAKTYPNLKIIESGANLGFAGGNNLAIKESLSEGFRFIALINPDTVLQPETLQGLVTTISSNEHVGAVQSKILIDGTDKINTFGNDLHYLGFSYCGNYKQPNKPIVTHEITIASGAAAIFSSAALKNIGMLDEDFFMYQEDADLSLRLWENGYKVLVSENSTIYHKYSFSRNKHKFYYFERNRLIIMFKNYDLRTLAVLFPIIIFTEALMLGYSLIGGWLNLKIKGYMDIIRIWPSIMNGRREVMAYKVVRDHTLKQKWVTDLVFEEVHNPLFIPLNLLFRIYWFLFGWLV